MERRDSKIEDMTMFLVHDENLLTVSLFTCKCYLMVHLSTVTLLHYHQISPPPSLSLHKFLRVCYSPCKSVHYNYIH